MNQPLNLQYANPSLLYTTQFIASLSDEEVVLDCGSIVVSSAQDEPRQLPIHTRMALPWSAVVRLHGLLGDLIESHGSVGNTPTEQPRASLPPLSVQPTVPTDMAGQ